MMYFNKGEFLELTNGLILEVVFADDEKAICLKLKKCHKIGWIYTGGCTAVSNKPGDYQELTGVKKVPPIAMPHNYRWQPLLPVLSFPMV